MSAKKGPPVAKQKTEAKLVTPQLAVAPPKHLTQAELDLLRDARARNGGLIIVRGRPTKTGKITPMWVQVERHFDGQVFNVAEVCVSGARFEQGHLAGFLL